MSTPENFLQKCVSFAEFGRMRGRKHSWTYEMAKAGMPVLDVPGLMKMVHVPSADRWFADRLKSRGRRVKAVEAA